MLPDDSWGREDGSLWDLKEELVELYKKTVRLKRRNSTLKPKCGDEAGERWE